MGKTLDGGEDPRQKACRMSKVAGHLQPCAWDFLGRPCAVSTTCTFEEDIA
jgi:hypothetical protein